jgi:endonuclease-8
MPEGDTVHAAAARLHTALAGRTVLRSELRVPRYATVDLRGRRVTQVLARGKHLLIRFDGADVAGVRRGDPALTLHSHLKMEGRWDVYAPGQRWRRPAYTARAVLRVDGAEAVGFELGTVELFPTVTEPQRLPPLGPDPLGPDWDPKIAARNLAADPERAIGHALLDQSLLAGIGNVYRNELCFRHRRHPGTPVGECGDPAGWVEDAHRLLSLNLGRSMRVTTGVDRPGRRLFVYDRARRPCLRCGELIAVGALGGPGEYERTIWWCPRCQSPGTAGDGLACSSP